VTVCIPAPGHGPCFSDNGDSPPQS